MAALELTADNTSSHPIPCYQICALRCMLQSMQHEPSLTTDEISLTKIRELTLVSPSQDGRPAHLSAASGLVRVGNILYVVADDEQHLGIFQLDNNAPGQLLRLREGELPLDAKARKRAKPDFETLLHLPTLGPYGGLLALGSGSKRARYPATCIELDANGLPTDAIRSFSLEHMYAAVAHEVGEVNIEGALIRGDTLFLFQRGNKGAGVNALIGFESDVLLAAMRGSATQSRPTPLFINRYELGSIGTVPLCFSDAAELSDGSIVFAAIAEDTTDSYADGQFEGAAIGLIDCSGDLVFVRRVRQRAKIEGIAAQLQGSRAELLLVTDDDDAAIAASLYTAKLDRA
jgi:hypothetical protein